MARPRVFRAALWSRSSPFRLRKRRRNRGVREDRFALSSATLLRLLTRRCRLLTFALMLEIALFGAGRIGQIHAANVARSEGARLRYVADVSAEAAQRIASKYGAQAISDPAVALADSAVGCVIVSSPTNTHVDLIIAAARAK